MKPSTASRFSALLIVFLLSNSLFGQESKPSAENSCRKFVQAFYDWYAPMADASPNPGAKSENAILVALKARPNAFTPGLRHSLIEDAKAQSKADEIVGIDYDPFLFSQDPCERYITEKVTIRATRCFVEVHAVCQGKRREKADVTSELGYQNGHWVFINFHYGENDNAGLVGNLKALRQQRARDRVGMK